MPILFNNDAREKLLSGISTIARAVKSTMGPGGRTVIIDSKNHTRGLTVTKDGVTVAKSVFSEDPIENLAIRIVREASENTADSAGDGTTTSVVIAEALVENGLPYCTGNKTLKITRAIHKYSEMVIQSLEKKARRVSKKNLEHVATISANGDRSIGKIISDTYKVVGVNGAVTIDKSPTSETYAEVSNGIKFSRGLYNQLFINDQITNECHLKDAYVLVTDIEIPLVTQIQHLLEFSMQQGKPILIIAPMAQSAIAILGANFRKGFKFVPVEPPSFGYKQTELLSDIAVALGAKFFNKNTGDNLELIDPEDLGRAAMVKISSDQTIIEPSELSSQHKDELNKRIEELTAQINITKKKKDKDFLRERLAVLNGKLATIFVGADSEVEQKEKIDRVDDAVCAVRSALEEGILPGGGIALLRESVQLILQENINEYEASAIQILKNALEAPFDTIMENAELIIDYDSLYSSDYEIGINASDGTFTNMYEAGIIDPLKVTKNALRNAVSVATTIMSTSTTITQPNQ